MNESFPAGYIKVEKEYVKKLATQKIEAIYNRRKIYAERLKEEESKEPEKYFFGLLERDTVDHDKVLELQILAEFSCDSMLVACQKLIKMAECESEDKYMWISDQGIANIK